MAEVRLIAKQRFNYLGQEILPGQEWEPAGHVQDGKILDNFIRVELVPREELSIVPDLETERGRKHDHKSG